MCIRDRPRCDLAHVLGEDGFTFATAASVPMKGPTVAKPFAGPLLNGIPSQLPDIDPDETAEWLESFDDVMDEKGRVRARYIILKLIERARARQVGVPSLTATDYINTIPPEREPWFPGDEDLERGYRRLIRWNAAIMVHRAQRPGVGVGGHISTYASAASLYEVGFNHFWRCLLYTSGRPRGPCGR